MATSYLGRTDLPRGIRDNNPGNIKADDSWQGMTGTDGPYVIFADQLWGLRALATDLTNKIRRGLNTITSIISTYAPPSENDTAKYIAAVSDDTGIPPGQELGLDWDTLHSLIRAITTHENGEAFQGYITDSDIDAGIQRMNDQLLSLIQSAGVVIDQVAKDTPGTTWIAVGGAALLIYLILAKN